MRLDILNHVIDLLSYSAGGHDEVFPPKQHVQRHTRTQQYTQISHAQNINTEIIYISTLQSINRC